MDLPGRPVTREELRAKFEQWRGIVDKMHSTTRFTPNDQLSLTPLRKPLPESTVALVSTAGVHLRSQPAFDLMDEMGDPSFREIPGTASTAELMISHSHYDTADAQSDPNVVFPLDRLRELVDEGTIGAISPVNIGMMGWNPNGERVKRDTAPEVARVLRDAGADVVIFTPG